MWYLGTIGFTYPEWKGSFYPSGLPASQSLNYYSRIFNAVEINTTFYGAQSPAQIQRWISAAPGDFRFCLKTPRRVTHDLRLVNAESEMRAFVESSMGLGDQLGALLVQLPPSFKADERPALERFLETLPTGPRYALEFRHPSWYVPATAQLLRQHQVAWVSLDYEDLPIQVIPTADFLYVRWIAKHNVIPHPGHAVIDHTERLRSWLARIRGQMDGIQAVFGFFDNDYAGHAPASCNLFKGLAGLPAVPTTAEEQGRLF